MIFVAAQKDVLFIQRPVKLTCNVTPLSPNDYKTLTQTSIVIVHIWCTLEIVGH